LTIESKTMNWLFRAVASATQSREAKKISGGAKFYLFHTVLIHVQLLVFSCARTNKNFMQLF